MIALDAFQPHTHAIIRVDVVKLMQQTLNLPRSNVYLSPSLVSHQTAPHAAGDALLHLQTREPQEHISLHHGLFGERGQQEEEWFSKWCQQYQQCTYVGHIVENMRQELILMSHLQVMVSMDSANMHLASLVHTPVVSIWGATHPYAGFMGWNQNPTNAVQVDLPCRPCSIYGNKPCMRGDMACMNQIKPEDIIQRIETVLKQK